MIHTLRVSMIIPAPREEVFSFFAKPENLEVITPPELRFRIVTPLPLIIKEGSLIDYRLSLFIFPFRWKTLISRWDPPKLFVDEQVEGPYAFWRHTHRFTKMHGGTHMEDEILYRLPFSPIGETAFPLIALQLRKIFEYRRKKITAIFNETTSF